MRVFFLFYKVQIYRVWSNYAIALKICVLMVTFVVKFIKSLI